MQDRGRQAEIAAIRPVAERVIRGDGVEARVLQRVGLQLGGQADAAALLVLVDHDATRLGGDRAHRDLDLLRAVAAQRAEDLAGDALRVDANERHIPARVPHDESERSFDPSRTV